MNDWIKTPETGDPEIPGAFWAWCYIFDACLGATIAMAILAYRLWNLLPPVYLSTTTGVEFLVAVAVSGVVCYFPVSRVFDNYQIPDLAVAWGGMLLLVPAGSIWLVGKAFCELFEDKTRPGYIDRDFIELTQNGAIAFTVILVCLTFWVGRRFVQVVRVL